MNDTLDVILVNRCNQSDEFRTVLPAKMCVRVLLIRMLAAAAVLVVGVGAAAGAELHVNPGESIQDAIGDAEPGDTIYVHAGEYCENVDVWKRVTLIGDGANVVTVRAADAADHVFGVRAEYVNIFGFTATGATYRYRGLAGIYLYDADHCNISNNNASENVNGIYLHDSSNNTLTNNIMNSNNWDGIRLQDSSDNALQNNSGDGIFLLDSSNNNTLSDNNASCNDDGIRLQESSNNTLHGNMMSGNAYNFGVYGDSLFHYTQNIDVSNTVDGKPIYYWVDQRDKQIPSDAGFVGVVNSTNITVKDLTLTKNSRGVLFAYANDSRIVNVTASNNDRDGIYLYDSSNNTLQSNDASNSYCGICLHFSNNNTLSGNTASDNYHGIYLRYSSNSILQNNIMSGNTYNFGVDSYDLSHYIQNIDASNTVDEKPIYYWVDQRDKQIPSDAGFVGVVNSTNVTVRDLILTKNNRGVLFVHTENSRIENINATNNHVGVRLYDSSNNTLQNNIASNNSFVGIKMFRSDNNILQSNIASDNHCGICLEGGSSNNTLQSNIASHNDDGIFLFYSSNDNMLTNNVANSNNGNGIYLYSSSDNNTLTNSTALNNNCGIRLSSSRNNTIYHNNLIDNTNHNAYDDSGANQWDSGTEGNYWSDYTGNDTNRDGIGDISYGIPGGTSVDRYPLTGIRWLPPEITRARLGINTHWYRWVEDFPAYEEKIKNFGIIRDGAWWYDLETSDLTGSEWDHANWDYPYNMETFCGRKMTYQSGYDNLVKLYQDEDSPELLMVLNQDNNNISSSDAITADQYSDYVYHIVERYDGDGVNDMPGLIRPVRYFEVGNEVDYGNKTANPNHDHIPPKDYVEKRLIPAYNAAKAANKDAIVMGAGLGMGSDLYGNDGQEFNTMYFDAMYDNITKNGGNNNNNFYMDKVAIHYYAKPNAEFDENIKKVEDVIQKYENRDKPIWITEFTPLTEIGPYDSTTGAFARLLTLMFANKIEMPVIYSLKDEYDVTCVGDEETITPRESIQVIDTVLSTLHGTTPSEVENKDISAEPGKTIYKRVFNNSGKTVTVLWYIDTADPGAVTNYEYTASPESPQTFTVDVLGTANFSTDPSPIHLKIGSKPTYVVGTDPPIDLDLYFNKTTAAGVATERATSFRVGDTLYGKLKTATSTGHTVKTYIAMTMPDGTCRYAHYDKPDFDPGNDELLFLETKVPLYDGVWSATTNDWLWNIYEFTGGDSGTYRWNCWYEDAETGEILSGNSTEYTFSETPSGTPVDSSTGRGEVYLDSSAGTIENLAASPPDAMPDVPEGLNPVYGFFSFEITGISSGESVNIPLVFPENMPAGTEYWKYGPTTEDSTPHWYQVPVSDDDGDRIIVITLTDGGIGDDDLAVNGVIMDDGGPSLPISKKGDLNGDNRITPADAAIVLRIAASGAHDDAADVSGDGCVTSLDALMILQAAAGSIEL